MCADTLQSKTSFNVSQLLFDNVLDEQIEENDAEKGLDNEVHFVGKISQPNVECRSVFAFRCRCFY